MLLVYLPDCFTPVTHLKHNYSYNVRLFKCNLNIDISKYYLV